MKFDYPGAQATAERLIAKFGELYPVIRFNKQYDAVNGQMTVTQYGLWNVNMVTLPATSSKTTGFDNRFKEDLKTGELRYFIVSANGLGVELTGGDQLLFDGKVWDIAGSTPLNPTGKHEILYNVGCKTSPRSTFTDMLTAIATAGTVGLVPDGSGEQWDAASTVAEQTSDFFYIAWNSIAPGKHKAQRIDLQTFTIVEIYGNGNMPLDIKTLFD